MAQQNFPDRVLYNMDNLDVLRGMNSETVDLIATDPPFNKKRNRAASASQYEDAWRWADDPTMQNRPEQWLWQPVHRIWLDQIQDENQALFQVIESTRLTQDDDTAAFLCFLGVRLLEMHRTLKPTGSIYLHCDHSANGYIRMAMDAIFGKNNFRNEIVWHYNKWTNTANYFQRNHDTIFLYGKSARPVFNKQYGEPTERQKQLREAGYNTGSQGGRKILRVYDREKAAAQIRKAEAEGRAVYYIDEPLPGAPVPDVWNISALNGQAAERTGSPDQKPVALYERMIAASSNPGDIVLDPFAGCATTPIAAQNLGRRWVGIDRREDAAYHVANRLLDLGINVNEFKAQHQALMPEIQAACEIRYIPPVRTDDGESAPHLGPVYRRRQPATMTRAAMMAIITAQWGIRCWGCGFEPPSVEFFELDHIRPASEGGSNDLENRAPLCGPCNKRKSNTMTLTALRRDNRRAGRWYGHPDIEQRIDLRLAGQWALDYLAQQRNPPETAGAS